MMQLVKVNRAKAIGEAYKGVAGRFILHGETEVLVVAPNLEALHAAFTQMDVEIDETMTGPVTVFMSEHHYPRGTQP